MGQMHQHLFWTNLNEIRKLSFPVLQDIDCFETTGCLSMSLNQVLQLRFPMFSAYGTGHKRIHIEHFMRHALRVIKISHAACHTGTKIGPYCAKYHAYASGHVLTPITA